MKKPRILIISAVPEEIALITEGFANKRLAVDKSIQVTTGSYSGYDLFLSVGGVGAVSMATTVTALISRLALDYVMLIGSGGGFSQAGIRVLDTAIATREIAPELGVQTDTPGITRPLPIAPNRIELDQQLINRAARALSSSSRTINVHCGSFVTVSAVTTSPHTARTYYQVHGAIVENMEGFGAAYPCRLFGIPLLELRVVSNEVGNTNKDQWHLREASRRAQELALLLLESEVFS